MTRWMLCGVHGAGRTIGAFSHLRFLPSQWINPIFVAGKAVGGLYGHGASLQPLVGILIAWFFAAGVNAGAS